MQFKLLRLSFKDDCFTGKLAFLSFFYRLCHKEFVIERDYGIEYKC